MVGWLGAFFSISQSHAQEAGKSFTGSLGKSQVSNKKEKDFHIRVKAPAIEIRNSFDFFCRDLDLEFRNILFSMKQKDTEIPVIPIRISIRGKDTDKFSGQYVVTKAFMVMDGIHISIGVTLHDRFDEDIFTREFIRALILEQMLTPLKNQPGVIPKELVAPDWMVHGFTRMIAHKRNGRPSAFFSGYIKSGQLLSVKEIFEQENPGKLDPLSLASYEASATALVDALRTQGEGRDALRSLMRDLAISGPNRTESLIQQHFPGLREVDNGLEKWWALQIATLGRQQALEFYDSEKTNRLLDEALAIHVKPKKRTLVKKDEDQKQKKSKLFERLKLAGAKAGEKNKTTDVVAPPPDPGFDGTIEQFTVYRKIPGWRNALVQNHTSIQQLKTRGFPLYRPLLIRYESAINRIAKNQLNGLDEEFKTLEQMRKSIRKTMELVDDYLNLYEAARAPEKSDAFDSYIRMRQAIEQSGSPKRNDRITNYLDEFEKVFRPVIP